MVDWTKKLFIAVLFTVQIAFRECFNTTSNAKTSSLTTREGKATAPATTVSPVTTTEPILPDWGGNCTRRHWDKCSNLTRWVTSYAINIKKPKLGFKTQVTNCTELPPICLRNGWTVTKCQLLCMRCNREILSKYEKYVSHEGEC